MEPTRAQHHEGLPCGSYPVLLSSLLWGTGGGWGGGTQLLYTQASQRYRSPHLEQYGCNYVPEIGATEFIVILARQPSTSARSSSREVRIRVPFFV